MVDWHLGTMGFGFKEWSGVFYPEGISSRDYLIHYSKVFDAVELDSTFYGTPRPEYVERWAAVTPESFKFCVKAPKEITHDLRLVGAVEKMNSFIETMAILGDKLGVILIQMPPDFTFSQIHNLAVFLRHLPTGFRFAVEFRHRSWQTTATSQLLQNHNICWASADYIHMMKRINVTSDLLYIRWIGRHGQFDSHDAELVDPSPDLEKWLQEIQAHVNEVYSVYGFFNNDYSGHSPTTCNRFKQLLGLPIKHSQPPRQGRLF
ncbi:MAG: DUF72 domain-containing protein [Candidatus Promineifilaceae bacterium]